MKHGSKRFSAILTSHVGSKEFRNTQNHWTEKIYIQATRAQNYQASLKLEGITATAQTTQQSKIEILQKYKKFSQPES